MNQQLILKIKVNLLSLEGKCPLCDAQTLFEVEAEKHISKNYLSWCCPICKIGGRVKIESTTEGI